MTVCQRSCGIRCEPTRERQLAGSAAPPLNYAGWPICARPSSSLVIRVVRSRDGLDSPWVVRAAAGRSPGTSNSGPSSSCGLRGGGPPPSDQHHSRLCGVAWVVIGWPAHLRIVVVHPGSPGIITQSGTPVQQSGQSGQRAQSDTFRARARSDAGRWGD